MAMLITILHTWMAYTYEAQDPHLTVFVKSKCVPDLPGTVVWRLIYLLRKHPYYLNGRFLFLLFSQFTMLCGCFLRNILLDRFVFRWSLASSSSVTQWPFRLTDLTNVSLTLAFFACICTSCSATFFAFARLLLPLVLKLPFLSYTIRPLTAHFLRGSWTVFVPFLHFSLLTRALLLSITTIYALEFADILFDSFVTQVSWIKIIVIAV
jgi:nucleoporin NDC1